MQQKVAPQLKNIRRAEKLFILCICSSFFFRRMACIFVIPERVGGCQQTWRD